MPMPTSSDEERRPRILIVGSGAMACALAARLAPHARISMSATWPEGRRALKSGGVQLEHSGGKSSFPVELVEGGGNTDRFQHALVLVKAWQTAEAALRMAPLLASDGLALTLQNGLGHRELLSGALGEGRVAVGVTTMGARLIAPGVVEITGEGPFYLGDHPRLDPLVKLLRRAGLEIQSTADIEVLLWRKLAINAGINPLTAILRVENGYLVQDPAANRLMRAAAREVAAVAQAGGVTLGFSEDGKEAEDVARRTAGNRSSMFQDVLESRPTEIESITGAVVRAADDLGVDVPVNRTLLDLVRSIVHHAEMSP